MPAVQSVAGLAGLAGGVTRGVLVMGAPVRPSAQDAGVVAVVGVVGGSHNIS